MTVSLSMLLWAAALKPASLTECNETVSRVIGAAGPLSRVVITFTGSQEALLPLDEAVGPDVESTFFPVGRDRFVLTLQVRSAPASRRHAIAFAERICQLAISRGGRFNGVMSFKRESMTQDGRTLTRERMIEAAMAELPQE